MVNQPQQNDPYRPGLTDEEIRRQPRVDNDLQADPVLAEGPASGAKVAMFALAIAVVLGAIFYGLNNSTVNEAGTSPTTSTAQTAPQSSPPAAPSSMRDLTPRTNTEPGTTTGAAPSRPQSPAPAPAAPPANPAPSR
ncbi:hypothetical protein [Bradyrhizobium sp.]|uniref:hypothetical protein n=1 Tax=Bradyrhizobium sp. TaxID=376 RepID=UPI000ADFBFA4|nr:hypothetical protein [Bradyrhizobium sp.]